MLDAAGIFFGILEYIDSVAKMEGDGGMYIRLDSVDKVQDFVKCLEKYHAEMDLISGRQEVDGKSLLGIFSLDLTKPLKVRILHIPEEKQQREQLQRLLCRFEV